MSSASGHVFYSKWHFVTHPLLVEALEQIVISRKWI